MENNFQTPILFLIFNRPDVTEKVFAEIKKIKPKYLYVASDGAREGKDSERGVVERTRKLVTDNVDWDCEVKTLFREKNLGCGKAVSSAITWFFENVSKGIILEDDCLPSKSFFGFCEELLEKYEDDSRVMHIGGYTDFGENQEIETSYYFSKRTSIWGWATWRRAWGKYDLDMSDLKSFLKQGQLSNIYRYEDEIKMREKRFLKMFNKEIDTWDAQWHYCVAKNNGLSIKTRKNLVKNIGLGEGATHTFFVDERILNNENQEIEFPLKHPQFVLPNEKLDRKHFEKFVNTSLFNLIKDNLSFEKVVKYLKRKFL